MFVGFEVLTELVMKSSIFWDITPCILLKVNRRFDATCSLHRQSQGTSRVRNQSELKQSLLTAFTLASCTAYSSTLKMERHVPPKLRLTFNELHGVISQRTELFN
jgi:hypothetical protein